MTFVFMPPGFASPVGAQQTDLAPESAPGTWVWRGETSFFNAPVIANRVLTGPASSGEKRHVELDLHGSGFRYEPGDAISILPRNDAHLVASLLERLGIAPAAPVQVEGRQIGFADALLRHFEIGVASPRFLRHWATLSGSAELRSLAAPENTEARRRYLRENHIGDIVGAYPVRGLDAAAVLPGLRSLEPRLYSIASSPTVQPGIAAITTSTLVYRLNGTARRGVVSGYQVPGTPVGSVLPIRVAPQPDFRLGPDEAPIIMVGAGTGIAPFRAFLAERRARGASGRAWLVFGTRTRASDFLYGEEWTQAIADGSLTRLDLALSREASPPVYVQHRLTEHGASIYAWLQEGASLYVCGDAARMAPAVHAALLAIFQEHGAMTRENAMAEVRRLARERRYQRSIY